MRRPKGSELILRSSTLLAPGHRRDSVRTGRRACSRASRAARVSERNTHAAPASSSSCSLKPPVNTPTTGISARLADSQSQVESPSITAGPPPAFSIAACSRSGSGLVLLDVARGRPAVDEVARVEQVEVVLDLVGLGRGGQHHACAPRPEALDQARARPRAAAPRRSAPCTAPSRRRGRPRRARRRTPRPPARRRAGRRPSRCGGGSATSGGRRRTAGTPGTTRSRGGSWCRRACRRRRGSLRAGRPPTRSRRCAPARRARPRRTPRPPWRRTPGGRRGCARTRGPRRRRPPRRPSGRRRSRCRSSATATR